MTGLIFQQFAYGRWNALVNWKHRQFPYVTYGSLILFALLAVNIVSAVTGNSVLVSNILFGGGFLLLTALVCARSERMSFGGFFYVYPGCFLRCLSNACGNIYSLSTLFRSDRSTGV
jgi:hypothetical protein